MLRLLTVVRIFIAPLEMENYCFHFTFYVNGKGGVICSDA